MKHKQLGASDIATDLFALAKAPVPRAAENWLVSTLADLEVVAGGGRSCGPGCGQPGYLTLSEWHVCPGRKLSGEEKSGARDQGDEGGQSVRGNVGSTGWL